MSDDFSGSVRRGLVACRAVHRRPFACKFFFLPLSFLLYFYYGTFATHLRVRITLLFTHFTHAFTLLMYFTTLLLYLCRGPFACTSHCTIVLLTLLLYLCCGSFACTFHFTCHFTYFSIYLCGPLACTNHVYFSLTYFDSFAPGRPYGKSVRSDISKFETPVFSHRCRQPSAMRPSMRPSARPSARRSSTAYDTDRIVVRMSD